MKKQKKVNLYLVKTDKKYSTNNHALHPKYRDKKNIYSTKVIEKNGFVKEYPEMIPSHSTSLFGLVKIEKEYHFMERYRQFFKTKVILTKKEILSLK